MHKFQLEAIVAEWSKIAKENLTVKFFPNSKNAVICGSELACYRLAYKLTPEMLNGMLPSVYHSPKYNSWICDVYFEF